MDEIIAMLIKTGWQFYGEQEGGSYRTASPGFGGSIVKTGGRKRFRKGDRRCTLGKRTASFFDMIASTPTNFKNFSVKHERAQIKVEAKA